MDEKVKGQCDRCNNSTNNITIMSKFNKDIICMACKEEERNHPEYQNASDVEIAECKKGNYNFEGIGLPDDLKKEKEEEKLTHILFKSETPEQLAREFEGEE